MIYQRCILLFLSGLVAIHSANLSAAVESPQRTQQSVQLATLTGRVLCADTQQPARAIPVTLIPAGSGEGVASASAEKTSLTQLDGTFQFDNVPIGDYFLAAELAGYVNESQVIRDAVSRGGDALKKLDSLPHVHLTAAGADPQFQLEKGASLSGTVNWEDGTPAAGSTVEVRAVSSFRLPDIPSDLTQPSLGLFLSENQYFPIMETKTDDHGRFRLAGLAAGGYVVEATKRIAYKDGQPGTYPLQAFELHKTRPQEAPVEKLSTGEERDNVDITLSVDGLHTVSGRVNAIEADVHSGSVELRDKNDGMNRPNGAIQMDGTFTINYVPAGAYDVVVSASSQTSKPTSCCTHVPPKVVQKQSLIVSDTDVVGLTLQATHVSPYN